jgi:hypothetical protein
MARSIQTWDADRYARFVAERGTEIASWLAAAVGQRIALIPRPTPIPGRLGDWLEGLASTFLNLLSRSERRELIDEIEGALAPQLRDADGTWHVDYVRLCFAAT